jgi:hypothetical protein
MLATTLMAATMVVAAVSAGCASAPPEPKLALQSAEQAIATADRARVPDSASPELSEARAKLTAARDEVLQKHMVQAERLANESRVDAELASATIETSKDLAVNDEITRSNVTLMQEMQRKQGVAQ